MELSRNITKVSLRGLAILRPGKILPHIGACLPSKETQHEHHLCVPFGATYEQTTWLASGSLANMFALHQCSLNKERDHMRSIQFGCSGQLCYSGLNSCTCILTNFRAQMYLDLRAAAKISGQTLRVVPLHAGG